MSKILMTREGFNKMSEQYNEMRLVTLPECLTSLTEAREKGDISENAEYEVAKQQLDDLNVKMSKMSVMLNNVQIIDSAIDDGTVQLLTYVKFKNLKTGQEQEFRIVPETEVSIKESKISPSSPIGKSLMNKKVGDKVQVQVPAGKLDLEVINIRCR